MNKRPWLLSLLAVFILAWILPSQAQVRPNPSALNEDTVRAERIGRLGRLLDRRAHEAHEELEQVRESDTVSVRTKAYKELQKMRERQKITHINAGYCDARAAERSCGKPGDPGDHGGGPGGPEGPGKDANGCAWASVGPTNINGRITAISIDPSNNQRIFVSTVGGIWRSTDGARTWQRVSDDFLATVFGSIVVNGAEVIAGGGDPDYGSPGDGLWRSTTNGDPGSWSKVAGTTFDSQTIYRLRLDPANGDIYVAASNGVWIGTHSGANVAFTRLGGFDAGTNDIAVDWNSNPRVVYAGVISGTASFARGIWKRSAGAWNQRNTGITTGQIQKIALGLAPSSPNTIYAKISNNTNGSLLGVFKTTTGGETPSGGGNAWASLPGATVMDDGHFGGGGGYSWYMSVIEVSPTDPNRVFAGGVNLYQATDGANFSNISGGADPNWSLGIHGDQHAVLFDPTNPKIVFVGNDGGLYASSDITGATWRWHHKSHGMVSTEFYRLTSQRTMASLLAGGLQDNGTEVTFGNRTWYQPGGCDGKTVAIDGLDPDTLYGNCNGGLAEFVNPVPGWQGGPKTIGWTSPATPVDPLVTDPSILGAALAQGAAPVDATGVKTGPPTLLKTTDGKTWVQANTSQVLTNSQSISTISIAPSSAFKTWYLGVSGANPGIWVASNGGSNWATTPTGLPAGAPNGIAVDATDPNRAFAAFDTGIWMTTNGTAWHAINGTGATAWLAGAAARAVAIDPNNSNAVYVAANVGVFHGTLSGTPQDASWSPMDEGLPDGLNVNGIWADKDSGLLSIATVGHGVFQRDIRSTAVCTSHMLLVRDNVYDRGTGPSPSGMADPEHPIPDPARAGFFKPDDSDAGKVYWWSSTDIRVDVPSLDPAANTLADADHVEAESCPIEMTSCPAETIWDNHPLRGQAANAYVQVSNQGLDPVQNVRVIALYADATSGLPTLPNDFWTTTFPAGSTNCGALTAGSGWSLVDTSQPCKVIPVVNPSVPATALFKWNVPAGQADHTCMLTITESVDDPLDASIRANNEVRPWVLVPNDRHISNRNLHVVDASPSPSGGSSGTSGMGFPATGRGDERVSLSISRAGMPPKAILGFMLPQGMKVDQRGIKRSSVKLSRHDLSEARRLGVDPRTVWIISPGVTEISLSSPAQVADKKPNVAFYWKLGSVPKPSTWRFSIVARVDNQIRGGSVYYLRVRAH